MKARKISTATINSPYIKWFREIGIEDVPTVGGKTASLGEMFRELTPKGVKVPDGFAITAQAYRDFLREAGLDRKIDNLLRGLETRNLEALRNCGSEIREAILSASFPATLEAEITSAYEDLRETGGAKAGVAVRSSATAEDLPEASFAGQQETYLNVRGRHALIDACRRCFASLFTDRAISYRADKGFEHGKIPLSIAVQCMVRSDLGAALFQPDKLDPVALCHRPLIVRDPTHPLGQLLQLLAVQPEKPGDRVIDQDLILVWMERERRIITGSDLLGRLLYKIVHERQPGDAAGERREK